MDPISVWHKTMNLDRLLPLLAPLVRRALRSKQKQREALFKAVPPAAGRVVFLGDSITELGAWEDWFQELKTTNRGISGQAICDVASRLDTAICKPAAISLLIGTNDLHGLGQSTDIACITEQMRRLVQSIRSMTDAPFLINSVMPRTILFRERIAKLNEGYQHIAKDNGATFIDLWPALALPSGAIRPELTSDGLHLSVAGYKVWAAVLRPQFVRLAT